MSVLIQSRDEAGGGRVAAHLRCPHCGLRSKSHVQQLSHVAASHPTSLDSTTVGRLGNILMYQSGVRLFHCSICFYTNRDFTNLYQHVISTHCTDVREEAGGGGEGEEEESSKRKRSSEGEHEDTDREDTKRRRSDEEGENDFLEQKKNVKSGDEEDLVKAAPNSKNMDEKEQDAVEKKMGEDEKDGGEKLPESAESREGEEENLTPNVILECEGKQDDGHKDCAEVKNTSEGDGGVGDGAKGEAPASVKAEDEGEQTVLMFDGSLYRCMICGWSHKQKSVSVSHIVRRHDIPKIYANQSLKKNSVSPAGAGSMEEEESSGLSEELVKEELLAVGKVVGFTSFRFECLICGWRSKLKGLVISHVVRCHDVERPYRCKECSRRFFLPSRLQQHVSRAHRPGKFSCPFCYFRSEYLGGFRRHCSRCNARSGDGCAGEEEEDEEEVEEKRETRRVKEKSVEIKEEEDEEELMSRMEIL